MGKTALAALAFVAFVILVAGCIQPVQKLGCCLKTYKKGGNTYNIDLGKYTNPSLGNTWLDVAAGDPAYGCMLYNMSDVEGSVANEYDYTGASTTGLCNSEADGTGAMCNVSIPAGATGAKDFLIPICSENDIIKCISGNCTAMVCGDFKFTPRVSPGFPTTAPEADANAANTKEQLAGGVSTQATGDVAVQFYKSQCRFLPMDAKLRNIMKNSKSQINVFRMGVGGSFDEFDQYRYYFPISDKFCTANPGGRVDRYMNYLTANAGSTGNACASDSDCNGGQCAFGTCTALPVAYDDPIAGIRDNCVNGNNDPPVLAFGESAAQRSATATLPGPKTWTFSYAPLVPDQTNYKFADYARFNNASDPVGETVDLYRTTLLESPIYTYDIKLKNCTHGVVRDGVSGYLCLDENGNECAYTNVCSDSGKPCTYKAGVYEDQCMEDGTGRLCPYAATCSDSAGTRPCTFSEIPGSHGRMSCKDANGITCTANKTDQAICPNGHRFSPCIEAFAACTDPEDPERKCTREWWSGSGPWTGGKSVRYLNTTCLTSDDYSQCNYDLFWSCSDSILYAASCGYSPSAGCYCTEGKSTCSSLYGKSSPTTAYYYTYDRPSPVNVFKKLDDGFYSSQLSIAHTDKIYDTARSGTTRAPFECDASGNDCYSGTCSTQKYSRSVMLTSTELATAREVVTDCNEFTDSAGIKIVTCAPTKSVALQAADPPAREYGSVTLSPVLTAIWTGDYHSNPRQDPPFGAADLTDGDELNAYWTNFYLNPTITVLTFLIDLKLDFMSTSTFTVKNPVRVSWTGQDAFILKQDCADADQVQRFIGNATWYQAYNETAATDHVWCPTVTESTTGPPLGGIVFFGKTGKDGNSQVVYNGDTIIGYSLLDAGDFEDTLLYRNCDLHATDYERIELSDPTDPKLTDSTDGLLKAFTPYFEQRVKGLGMTLGSSRVNANSVVTAFLPWVVNFEKGTFRTNRPKQWVVYDKSHGGDDSVGFTRLGYFLTSQPAQSLRQRNVYDEDMDQMPGTRAAELDARGDPWSGAEYTNNDKDKNVYHTYSFGFSKSITLIKYDGSGKLGTCAIDTNTLLPAVRTLGWCEPCTTSTLAFQKLTAAPDVYLPRYTAKLDDVGARTYVAENVQPVCSSALLRNDVSGPSRVDNATCFNAYITDMDDYTGSLGVQGSPRTVPDATIVKERLGNYMKSGIMPVLDISDRSEWNLTHTVKVGNNAPVAAPDYTEYDFERLFGSMGAAVVIVDHVGSKAELDAPLSASENLPPLPASSAGPTRLDRIIKRSGIVRLKCPDCLTAVHVDAPSTSGCDASDPSLPDTSRCLNKTLRALLADPEINFNIDLITFDYPASDHPPPGALTDPVEKAKAVTDDIASYGTTSLKAGGKPVMVVGFNVDSGDPEWQDYYVTLFDTVALNQAELVQSGVVGVIYSPARGSSASSTQSQLCIDMPVSYVAYYQNNGIQLATLPKCGNGWTPTTDFKLYKCGSDPNSVCTAQSPAFWGNDKYIAPPKQCPSDLSKCTDLGMYDEEKTLQSNWIGLVDNTTGVGVKTDKFCDFEDAMQKMSSSVPVAIFNRVMAQDVECSACSGLDYATGVCDDTNTGPQLQCDDGNPCKVTDPVSGTPSVPTGDAAKGLRCPAGAVTAECTLCTAKLGRFACTYFYTNGTTQSIRGEIPQLSSDAYSEIIAALPKPGKCCLEAGGSKYAYSKQTYAAPVNKPLAFPKTGDTKADCGMGMGVEELLQAGSFCNYQLPIRQYDITCQVA